jgi:hypothetical protein
MEDEIVEVVVFPWGDRETGGMSKDVDDFVVFPYDDGGQGGRLNEVIPHVFPVADAALGPYRG